MGKVNICLKLSYIVVIILWAVISVTQLGFILVFQRSLEFSTAMTFWYAVYTVNLGFLITGGFGACKEKQWALIVFAVGMILIFLSLLVSDMLFLTRHLTWINQVKTDYLSRLPLTDATKNDLTLLDFAQKNYQCCGLESYKDWVNAIPESCLCAEDAINPCLNVNVKGRLINIYSEPCLPVIIPYITSEDQWKFGIILGELLLCMLSIGLSIAMLCQMNEKPRTPEVVYSPEADDYGDLTEAPHLDQT